MFPSQFSRFTSARDIPTEFISKGVCLQGRVTNVQLESPKISSLMMINGGQAYSPIRISVEHTPILNARRYLKQSPAPLHIELACIWCTSKGLEQLQELIKDQDIWFQIYGIQQDDNLLYSSILLKKVILRAIQFKLEFPYFYFDRHGGFGWRGMLDCFY